MSNRYFGEMNTHPAYFIGGYECIICKTNFKNKKEYNEHVFKNHTKEQAREILDWKSYYKHYEYENYKTMIEKIKKDKEERRRNSLI